MEVCGMVHRPCRGGTQHLGWFPGVGGQTPRAGASTPPHVARGTRRRGGIEPLHVSMPRELKSRPGTSPTHSGCAQLHRECKSAKVVEKEQSQRHP